MHCPNCNGSVTSNQLLCPYCGLRLSIDSGNENRNNPNDDFYFGDNTPKKKKNIPLLVLIIIVTLLLLGVVGFWLHGKLTNNSFGNTAVATEPSKGAESTQHPSENHSPATAPVQQETADYERIINGYINASGLQDNLEKNPSDFSEMTTTVFGEGNVVAVEYHVVQEVENEALQAIKNQMEAYFNSMSGSAATIIEEIEQREAVFDVSVEFRCYDAKGNLMVSKQYK